MNQQHKGNKSKEKGADASERAILSGIETYHRTQRPNKTKSLGEERSREAMQEAGLKQRRPSRAKGKGTKLVITKTTAERKDDKRPSPAPMSEEGGKRAPQDKGTGRPTAAKGKEGVASGKKSGAPKGRARSKRPVKILFFGGVGEIGKNMTAIEYGNDIIVIDAGIIFPTEDMPGIDLVFPEITYLTSNRQKIRGVFLTHGHEDHIGGVPYLMKELLPDTPVYGTKLTLALVDNKLREHKLSHVNLVTVKPKDRIKAGAFCVNIVNVNHSIAGATALAVETPYGIIFHSGDFKIDLTPVAGSPIDLREIAEYGKRGVLLYLGESTNIERSGYTMSEKVVGTTLEHLFAEHADRRIIIATFASNVHRLQQIIDIAEKFRRKVALSGRSMLSVVDAAAKIGEITIPEGMLVDVEKVKNYYDREIVIVSTGSQGEPMSALTRMAAGEFNQVSIGENDTIIISASPIPGNERMIYGVINNLTRLGAKVVYESLEKIHVSGHACEEEHKIIHALLSPKFFIPIHGEYRHLKRHAALAEELGMPAHCIFIPEIGSCAEVTDESLKRGENFPAGARLIDGSGFEDLGKSEVLKDRVRMAEEGIFLVGISVSGGAVVGDPVVESRGFVFADEKEEREAMRELKAIAARAIKGVPADATSAEIENAVRRAARNYIFKRTKQSPLIIPIINEV